MSYTKICSSLIIKKAFVAYGYYVRFAVYHVVCFVCYPYKNQNSRHWSNCRKSRLNLAFPSFCLRYLSALCVK